MPDTEDPKPPGRVEEQRVEHPTEIDDDEYHMRADEYMDAVNEKAEQIQEERGDVEVEFAVSTNPGTPTDLKLRVSSGRRPLNSTPTTRHVRYQQTAAE